MFQVPIITDDDEHNCDDDLEDEFRSMAQMRLNSRGSSCGGGDIFRLASGLTTSRGSSISLEEEDEADSKETLYYLPCVKSDVDDTSERCNQLSNLDPLQCDVLNLTFTLTTCLNSDLQIFSGDFCKFCRLNLFNFS